MSRSLRIGTAFGIGIYLHWTVVFLPLWIVVSASGTEGPGIPFLLVFTSALVACLILHELGHALAARLFGIGTRDITMYPIGGVARLERMSEKPWEEMLIAIAGPAVNVVIAMVLGAAALVLFTANPQLFETVPGKFLGLMVLANVVLVVFNMLPAFPMDGGRILRACLSTFLGHLRATRIAAGVAACLALFFGLWGVGALQWWLGEFFQYNPPLVVIAGFVYLVGQRELQMVEMRERIRKEEPLEVLPVLRPGPAKESSIQDRPPIAVYTWDSVNGTWVREGDSRPGQHSNHGWH
jgi:Zn-dependent protease